MIPLIRNGKTLDFITALSDAISCVRSVKADGNVEELTLTYPVTSQGANYIKCFNIIAFEYEVSGYKQWRWYVITKVVQKDLIITATAEELVRFMMRRSYPNPTYSYDETELSGKISSLTTWDIIMFNWGHNTYPPRLRFYVHPDQTSEDIATTSSWVVSDYITIMDAICGKENSLCDIYNRQLLTGFIYDPDFASDYYQGGHGYMYFGIFDLVKNKNTHLKWKKEIESYTLETNAANVATQVTSYYSDLHGPGIAPTSPDSVSYGGPVLGNDWFVEDLSARRDATNDYERRPTEAQFTSISSKYLGEHRNPTQRISIEVGDMRGVEIALHEILNIWLPGSTEAIQSKVTDYEYDELRERYTKIGLGAPRKSFARAVARDVSPKLYQT